MKTGRKHEESDERSCLSYRPDILAYLFGKYSGVSAIDERVERSLLSDKESIIIAGLI